MLSYEQLKVKEEIQKIASQNGTAGKCYAYLLS